MSKKKIALKRISMYLLGMVFVLCSYTASAQLYIGKQTDFVINKGGLVQVNNDVVYEGDSLVENKGVLALTLDWINNSDNDNLVFSPTSTGNIILEGDLQYIKGNTTVFPQLTLDGTGSKELMVNTVIRDYLRLQNSEMVLNAFDATVLNTDIDAITYDYGYVNSSRHLNGRLIRRVTGGEKYIYPMGADGNDGYKFRPIELTSQADAFIAAEFQHYNPLVDTYPVDHLSENVKGVSDKYYHAVTNLTSTDSISYRIIYNESEDGEYDGLAFWDEGDTRWRALDRISVKPFSGGFRLNKQAVYPSLISRGQRQVLSLANINIIDVKFKIPNVFTPNGDSKNDKFVIVGLDKFPENELVVFNRWGNVVFQKKKYENDWIAEGLSEGTYYYSLSVKLENGRTKAYTGYIMVLR